MRSWRRWRIGIRPSSMPRRWTASRRWWCWAAVGGRMRGGRSARNRKRARPFGCWRRCDCSVRLRRRRIVAPGVRTGSGCGTGFRRRLSCARPRRLVMRIWGCWRRGMSMYRRGGRERRRVNKRSASTGDSEPRDEAAGGCGAIQLGSVSVQRTGTDLFSLTEVRSDSNLGETGDAGEPGTYHGNRDRHRWVARYLGRPRRLPPNAVRPMRRFQKRYWKLS